MSIIETIARLERELEEAKKMHDTGFSVRPDYGGEYYFADDHIIIEDLDGSIAGIILNKEIMSKYFESVI